MATEIITLELDELSLVGKGANQYAKAPIFKSDSGEDVNKMTDDQKAEMDKMSQPMKDKMKMYMDKGMDYAKAKAMCNEDMKKSLEEEVATLKAENEKLRKSLLDEGFRITAEGIEKKAPEEFIEIEGEKINKADIPAPILKRLEEAEVAKRDAELTEKAAKTLPNWDQKVAKSLMEFDFAEEVLQALMAADALFESMTEEVGKSSAADDMMDPNEKMNALVKAYAQEHKMIESLAYSEVAKTDEGKSLIKAIYKKD